jgi:hypothetical protein
MSRGAGKLEQLTGKSHFKPISNSEVCFWQLAAIIAGPWQPIAVWVALRAPLGGATLAVKFGGKDRVNE